MLDLLQERVEPRMGRLDQIEEPVLEDLEAGMVVLVAAGEMRRDIGIGDLVLRAGDDADPGTAGTLDRREQDHVIDRDQVRLEALEMRVQPLFRQHRGIDDRLPDRDHIGRQLIDRREFEMRHLLGDEVGPELGDLLVGHAARHIDQVLLEAVFFEHALEALVADEDRIVAGGFQLLRDADAVQSRPEGRLGKQHDGLGRRHSSPRRWCREANSMAPEGRANRARVAPPEIRGNRGSGAATGPDLYWCPET